MNIIWLLGLFIIAYLARHWYVCPARLLKKRKFHHTKPSIVFDLHGVIIHKNLFKICQHAFQHAYRIDLLFLFCSPLFIRDALKLFKKSRVPEEFVIKLSQSYPQLEPFLEVTITMMNEQTISPSMLKLIKNLKKQGYQLYLFSNIGEKTFNQLEKKFPNLFSYFDGIVVAEQQDNWIQKPRPQAFAKLLARFGLKAKECIFIDNNHNNVKTALQEGMYPILFQSPEQLFHELDMIGIV